MEFNEDKFALLYYGSDDKVTFSYHSSVGGVIREQEHVKDLGITMYATGEFTKLLTSKCNNSLVIFLNFRDCEVRPLMTM